MRSSFALLGVILASVLVFACGSSQAPASGGTLVSPSATTSPGVARRLAELVAQHFAAAVLIRARRPISEAPRNVRRPDRDNPCRRRPPSPLSAPRQRRLVLGAAPATARDEAICPRRTGLGVGLRLVRGRPAHLADPAEWLGCQCRPGRRAVDRGRCLRVSAGARPTSVPWRRCRDRRRTGLLPASADHGRGPLDLVQLRRRWRLVHAVVVLPWKRQSRSARRARRDVTSAPSTSPTGSPSTWIRPVNIPTCFRIGELVEVTGIFDHPAAASCTRTEMDGEPASSPGCRLEFAVTRLLLQGP